MVMWVEGDYLDDSEGRRKRAARSDERFWFELWRNLAALVGFVVWLTGAAAGWW